MTASLRLFALVLPALAWSGLRAAETPQDTVVTSDRLDAYSTDTKTFTTFAGHVVVTGTDLRITCDLLETISSRVGNKSDTVGNQAQFEHLQATGHVHIVQGDREAVCGRAEVIMLEDKIVLTRDPVVTDRGNGTTWAGDSITMLRSQRKVFVDHPHVTGPPIKDLGFDKSQPPPTPAPAPPQE